VFWVLPSPEHFERAFAQRRELIVGESFQLKIDVMFFNELNAGNTLHSNSC